MIQIARRFPGQVEPCRTCGRQPLHVQHRGRDLHSCECPPCGITTARLATAQQALEAWTAQSTTPIAPASAAA